MQSQREVRYDQTRIIRNANRYLQIALPDMHVELNQAGVCAGLAARYLVEKGRGKENEFFDKLRRISELTPNDYTNNLDAVRALIMEVIPVQAPRDFIKINVQQGDIDYFFAAHGKDMLERKFFTGLTWKVDALNQLITQTLRENEMVWLSANLHAIAVYIKNGIYYVFDPNCQDGEVPFRNLDEATRYIKESLFVKHTDTTIDISIKSFGYKNDLTMTKKDDPRSKAALAQEISPENHGYYRTLIRAAKVGDVEMFQIMLDKNADPLEKVNVGEYPNSSAFSIAALYDAADIVKLILSKKEGHIPVDALQNAILHGLGRGHKDLTLQLIAYVSMYFPNHMKENFIDYYNEAVSGGNYALVKWVGKFNPHPETAKQYAKLAAEQASLFGHSDLLNELLAANPELASDKTYMTRLARLAVQKDRFHTYTILSKHVDRASLPLMDAIASRNPRCVSHMVNAGAEITIDHVKEAVSTCQLSALMILLQHPENQKPDTFKTTCKALLEALKGDSIACQAALKAFPQNFGNDLLLLAEVNNVRPLTAALHSQYDISKNNEDARKQFALACMKDNVSVVRRLLHYGLDPTRPIEITDPRRPSRESTLKTPLELAEENPDVLLLFIYLIRKDLETNTLMMGETPLIPRQLNTYLRIGVNDSHLDLVVALATVVGNPEVFTFDPYEAAAKKRNWNFLKDLLPKRLFPIEDVFVALVIRAGRQDIFNLIMETAPEIRNDVLNGEEINRHLRLESTSNNSLGLEMLLHHIRLDRLPPPDEKVLTEILEGACRAGSANAVDVLLRYNAKFKPDDPQGMLQLLYAAYKIPLPDGRLDPQPVLDAARNNGHNSIAQILRSGARLSETNVFTSDSVILACQRGDVESLANLDRLGKLKTHTNPKALFEKAAVNSRKDVLKYLIGTIGKEAQEAAIRDFVKNDVWPAVVFILECMHVTDLTPQLREELKRHKVSIDIEFKKQLQDNVKTPEDIQNAKLRSQNARRNENALGVIIHAETKRERTPSPPDAALRNNKPQ